MKRIYQIDLFRFIAALIVVLYHYLFRSNYLNLLSNNVLIEFGEIFKYGYLGVDMFFIISGFVIILSVKTSSLKQFVISRISRLYPIYWICLILSSIFIILFGFPAFKVGFLQFMVNLTMFQNYLGVESVDGVYWTLFVEMKFYIFIIGLFLALNKVKKISLYYLIYFWITLTILYVFFNDLFFIRVLNYFFILNWSSYFISGIIFYQIFKEGVKVRSFVLLVLCLVISLYNAILKGAEHSILYNTLFSPYVIVSIITQFYILMFLVSTNKLQYINSPKLIKLGMLTYPLYLLHQNIGYIIIEKWGNAQNEILVIAVTVVIILFLSYILSAYYEPKMASLIKENLKKIFLNIKA